MGLFSLFKKSGVLVLAQAIHTLLSGKAPGAFAGKTSLAVKSLKNTCKKILDEKKGGSNSGTLLGTKISSLSMNVKADYATVMEKVSKNPKTVGDISLKHLFEGLDLLVEVNTRMVNFKTGEHALELDAMKLQALNSIKDLQKKKKSLEAASVRVAAAKRGLLVEKQIIIIRKKMSHNLAKAEMKRQIAQKLRIKTVDVLDIEVDWERWDKIPVGKGSKVKVHYKHP